MTEQPVQPVQPESPGTPEWGVLGVPEDDTAEPDDAGHGEPDDSSQ